MARAEDIAAFVDARADEFEAMADDRWDRPELRWQEFEAVRTQVDAAERHGFRVSPQLGGIPTAFYAEAGHGEPVIALLGEFDALAGLSQADGVAEPRPDPANPTGIGQGCGHHLLGNASLLAAVAVKEYLSAHGLDGTVRYYGCPAEEAAAGKAFMVKAGAFAGVDAAVSWHPAGTTGVARLLSLAYCQVYFRFTGISAHAGASPHLGRSALDAVELMNVGVNFLREHMPSDDRVHYAITDAGGASPNVVQATAAAYYIVRSPTVVGMRELLERVTKIARGAALMTETELSIEFDGACAELLPNDVLEAAMQDQLAHLGGVPFDDDDLARAAPFLATLAPRGVAYERAAARIDDDLALHVGFAPLDTAAPRPQMTASTDVGDVSWVVPTVQCTAAVAAVGTPAHSWQLVAQGKLPAAHKGMRHAAKIMAATVVDMITGDGLLDRATAEFQGRIAAQPYAEPIPDDVLPPPLRGQVST